MSRPNFPKYLVEFVRYFWVSLIALVCDFSIFFVLLRIFSIAWPFAAGFGFCSGLLVAWWLSIRYVFKERALAKSPLLEFLGFLIIGAFGLLVTEFILFLAIDYFKLPPEFGKFVAAGATFIFNFLLRKLFLFRKLRGFDVKQ